MRIGSGDLTVHSPAFGAGERIPERHTAKGENISPALEWSGVPPEARQLAVVCLDPDAPWLQGFTHWVLYGIPATVTGVPEGGGGLYVEGVRSKGQSGYSGPNPPPGNGIHHYYFFLYALDTEITDGPGLTREELLERIDGHTIAMNRLVGTYTL